MYSWSVYLVVTLVTVNLQYTETRGRVLNLDCGKPKRKYRVTEINLEENEDCFAAGWIHCLIIPSRDLTSLNMKGTRSPEATFPGDTWSQRELKIYFDNSELIIAPNTSVYGYLLPRSFETGDGFVDVECDTATGPVPTGYTIATSPSPTEAVPAPLSTLHIALITLAVLLFLAVIIGVVIFLIRRRWLRGHSNPTRTGRGKKKPLALAERSISTENKYWTKGDMGIAVYVDPGAANNYDNKDQAHRDDAKPTAGEYSYSYMQTKPKAKVHGSGKEAEQNSQKYSYAYMDSTSKAKQNGSGNTPGNSSQKYSYAYMDSTPKAKQNASGNKPGNSSQKYSYAYMDTASARADHGNGTDPEVNRQMSEVPYEDVEGDGYSYTYSAVLKPSSKNTRVHTG